MISVFTPSHNARFLDECWKSLAAQTFSDFEWVVVLNGDAQWKPPPNEPRIRVVKNPELRGVGAAKAFACRQLNGDIFVELDHDDILRSDALEQVWQAFSDNPDAGFVYSDMAQVLEDGSRDDSTWDTNNGWNYHHVNFDGRTVLAVDALEATPHNVSYIWFAPNHVRAFRRWVYDEAGGYNPDRDILDDQDVMCRMYQVADFVHIPLCLYLQRVHPGMTQRQQELNDRIQSETLLLYDKNIEGNAKAWAKRNNLAAYDLGGAHAPAPGYKSIDKHEPADLVGDVFTVLGAMPDSCVGVIRAMDFLEHVEDKIRLINEIHRVLAPDGLLISCTPSTDGRGAYQDPTHVSYWNENSWWYYSNADYAAYVPEITARFQSSRCVSFFPTDFHRNNSIPYVQANMIALKPGAHRNGGYLHWPSA